MGRQCGPRVGTSLAVGGEGRSGLLGEARRTGEHRGPPAEGAAGPGATRTPGHPGAPCTSTEAAKSKEGDCPASSVAVGGRRRPGWEAGWAALVDWRRRILSRVGVQLPPAPAAAGVALPPQPTAGYPADTSSVGQAASSPCSASLSSSMEGGACRSTTPVPVPPEGWRVS